MQVEQDWWTQPRLYVIGHIPCSMHVNSRALRLPKIEYAPDDSCAGLGFRRGLALRKFLIYYAGTRQPV